MVRTNRQFQPARRSAGDGNPQFNDETTPYSTAPEDIFEELIADLTFRPDGAPSESAGTRFPPVDDIRSEDIAARRLASKLAPNRKARVKMRRPRPRKPHQDRWGLADEQARPDERLYADNRSPHHLNKTQGRRWRRLFWGIAACILVAAAIPAGLGFVRQLDGLVPGMTRVAPEERSFSLAEGVDESAAIRAAGNETGSDPNPLADPPGPDMSIAAPAIPPAPTNPVVSAAAAAPLPPAVPDDGPETDEQAGSLAEAGGQTLGSSERGLERVSIDGAAVEAGTPRNTPTPGEKTEDRLQEPDMQQTAQADPAPATGQATAAVEPAPDSTAVKPAPDTTALEPGPGNAPPVTSPLSGAQIDRLLGHGEELLQRGDIVSARMAFLRVASAGDPRGAMGVGMTYDPDVFTRLLVTGMTPDREQADYWYDKAGNVPTFSITGRKAAETPALQADSGSQARPVASQEQAISPAQPAVGSEERNAACARKYKSFDPETQLYTSFSGVKRPCRLP